MAQKTNPLSLRIKNSLKNSIAHQQCYHKKFLTYSLNEQEKLTKFTYTFLKKLGFNLHSFNYIKDQTNRTFLSIKYTCLNENAEIKKPVTFLSVEEAYLIGLEKLGKTTTTTVSFFRVEKYEKQVFEIPNYLIKNSKILSAQECQNTLKIVKSEGGALFLTEFICNKLESLRSKSDKKLQSRLILFVEKLLTVLKKGNHEELKGLKIQIKGRINGIARSKKSIIQFGALNLQQLNAKIDYSYKQAFTVFGSFGIKVWINNG